MISGKAALDYFEALVTAAATEAERRVLERMHAQCLTKPEQKQDQILVFKEVLAYLRISQSTLRRMVADKQIKYFRVRGQYFFRQSKIDEWITEQEG